jgi:hypothetical protein
MARYSFQGTFRDGQGNIVKDGTVSVFQAGTTTPATIYTTDVIVTSVNSVDSDEKGYFIFYVDESDYGFSQLFDIVLSKTGYDSQTYENIAIVAFASPNVDYLSNYGSFAAAITSIGATVKTLVIDTAGAVSDDTTVPATLNFYSVNSGILTVATGKTLTINGSLEPCLHKVFECTGTGKVVIAQGGCYDAVMFGIIPGSDTYATNNTKMLRMLVSPATNGGMADDIPMKVTFLSVGTYYFDDIIPMRYDTHLDICKNTLRLDRVTAAVDCNVGFLCGLSDIIVENGTVQGYFDNTAAVSGNPCNVMWWGSRNHSVGSIYFAGSYDSLLPRHQGNIILRNLTIEGQSTSGGTEVRCLQFIGGLENVLVENVTVDGQSSAIAGIDYEYGFAEDPYTAACIANPHLKITSHAMNMVFRNIILKNINTNAAFALRGAYNCTVDGLVGVEGIVSLISAGTGEAAFYNPWSRDTYGVKAVNVFRNIVGKVTANGISISSSCPAGYLNTAPATELDEIYQADLTKYVLENFRLTGGGTYYAISGDGDLTAKNGYIEGFARGFHYGILGIKQRLIVDGLDIFDCTQIGIYIFASTAVYATTQYLTGSIRNCYIANIGSDSIKYAILADYLKNFVIEANKFGGDKNGGSTEASMLSAVTIYGTSCSGVIVRNNNVVDLAAGGVAYREAPAASPAANFLNTDTLMGDVTTLGSWIKDSKFKAWKLKVAKATSAAHVKLTTASVWNGDANAETTEFTKGETAPEGWCSLDAGGTVLKILDAAVTGNFVAIIAANVVTNVIGTAYDIDWANTSGGVMLYLRSVTAGTATDWTAAVGAGYIQITMLYLTSA